MKSGVAGQSTAGKHSMGMTAQFDMKKVTTPLLLYLIGQELRFPRIFLLMRKLTLNHSKKIITPVSAGTG